MSAPATTRLHRLADGRPEHRTALRRVDAVFGAMVWWAMHLAAMYWLIPRVCELGTRWPLHAVTVVLFGLCVRAWLTSLQLLRAGRAADPETDLGATRDLYLGWLGILFSVFFGAVVIAEWLPSAVLGLGTCPA